MITKWEITQAKNECRSVIMERMKRKDRMNYPKCSLFLDSRYIDKVFQLNKLVFRWWLAKVKVLIKFLEMFSYNIVWLYSVNKSSTDSVEEDTNKKKSPCFLRLPILLFNHTKNFLLKKVIVNPFLYFNLWTYWTY